MLFKKLKMCHLALSVLSSWIRSLCLKHANMCGHTRPTWPIRHFSGQPDQRLLLLLNEEYRSIASEIDTIRKQIESFMAGKACGFAAKEPLHAEALFGQRNRHFLFACHLLSFTSWQLNKHQCDANLA
jgi:hypothetical protein